MALVSRTWLAAELFTLYRVVKLASACFVFLFALFNRVFCVMYFVCCVYYKNVIMACLSEEQIRELEEISSESEDNTDSDPVCF